MITRNGRNYVLDAEIWLPRSPDELFAFFSNAQNLVKITPAFLQFNILTPTPIVMMQGTIIDYRLKVRGLPIRWRTLIEEWNPPHRFVDVQTRGPYTLWRHEHTFTPHKDGTLIRDRVEFRSRGGILAPLLHRLIVNRDVQMIFHHRTFVLRTTFGGQSEPRLAVLGIHSSAMGVEVMHQQ